MRGKLTYANVMSTVAAFLALAGGSTAIALKGKNSVKAKDIASNAVKPRHIAKGAVRSWEVRNETLKAADIGPGAVGSSEIIDGAVKAAEIATGAVGSSQILDGSVGTAELGSVPAARINRGGSLSVNANSFFGEFPLVNESTADTFDPYDMWDPADPGVITVPEDGLYLATAEVSWVADDTASPGPPLADQGLRLAQISSGGNGTERSAIPPIRSSLTARTSQQLSGVFDMDAGEEFSLGVSQENEDDSAIGATATLAVIWLAPGV